MKTTIDKEFFEKWKDEGVAMWCKKEEYAKEFCRLMDEQGLTWYKGISYLNAKMWYVHKEKTAYEFNNGNYCSKGYYENKDYIILDFEDYIVHEQETAEMEMYEYEIREITEEGNVSTILITEKVENDLEQYEKLFKDIKKLNTALTKAVVETLLKDNVVEEKEINSLPAHYNIAGIDTMDFIIATCEHNDTNQRETFYLANTLKYLIRYKNKNGLEDLKKAKDYLNRLIEYTTIESLPFYDVDGQGD